MAKRQRPTRQMFGPVSIGRETMLAFSASRMKEKARNSDSRSAYARSTEGQGRRRTARAARKLCLIRPAAMFNAVGEARIYGLPAEMEIGLARVTHGPATYLVRQIQQARLVGDLRTWFGRYQSARRRWRDRSLLIARALTEKTARTDRNDLGQVRRLVGQGLRRD